MIFEIEISNQADADLRSIYEYIAYELQSHDNASGQLDRLEESIMSLDQMPERLREYKNEPWHSRGLRIITYPESDDSFGQVTMEIDVEM